LIHGQTYSKWQPFLNLDLEQYYKGLTHMRTNAADDGDSSEAPVKVDVSSLRTLLEDNINKEASINEEIPQEPIRCGAFMINANVHRQSLKRKYQVRHFFWGALTSI